MVDARKSLSELSLSKWKINERNNHKSERRQSNEWDVPDMHTKLLHTLRDQPLSLPRERGTIS